MKFHECCSVEETENDGEKELGCSTGVVLDHNIDIAAERGKISILVRRKGSQFGGISSGSTHASGRKSSDCRLPYGITMIPGKAFSSKSLKT